MNHWRGRSTAVGRSADRNDGGLFAQPGRIARRFALTVKTPSPIRCGTCPLRITGTGGSLVHQATAALTIPGSELADQRGAFKVRVGHRITVAAAVLAVVVVAGCGSGGDHGSGGSGSTPVGNTSAPASASTSSSGANVEVTIAAGKVAPDPSRKVEVATGDHVHLSVTSDHADEVHVHGYDIEKEVSAGGTVTIDFTADIPGQFEVEAHKLSPSLLFTLVVN